MPGKLRSDNNGRNGAKHSLYSAEIVLKHEDGAAYERFRAAFLDEWQPATPTEEGLVLDMVNARWRLQRIQQLMTVAIEGYMKKVEKHYERVGEGFESESALCVEAHACKIHQKTLDLFERWEERLHRTFHRALKTLRSLQKERASRTAAGPQAASRTPEIQNERNEPNGEQVLRPHRDSAEPDEAPDSPPPRSRVQPTDALSYRFRTICPAMTPVAEPFSAAILPFTITRSNPSEY
jgi:hypothetical protein